jgi:hypothetical protein
VAKRLRFLCLAEDELDFLAQRIVKIRSWRYDYHPDWTIFSYLYEKDKESFQHFDSLYTDLLDCITEEGHVVQKIETPNSYIENYIIDGQFRLLSYLKDIELTTSEPSLYSLSMCYSAKATDFIMEILNNKDVYKRLAKQIELKAKILQAEKENHDGKL